MSVCVVFFNHTSYGRHYFSSPSMKEKRTVTPRGASGCLIQPTRSGSYVKPSVIYGVGLITSLHTFLASRLALMTRQMHGSHCAADITQSSGSTKHWNIMSHSLLCRWESQIKRLSSFSGVETLIWRLMPVAAADERQTENSYMQCWVLHRYRKLSVSLFYLSACILEDSICAVAGCSLAGWSVTVDVCQRRMLVFAACLRPSVSSIPLLLCLSGEERGEKGESYQLKVTSCQPANKMTLCFPVSFSRCCMATGKLETNKICIEFMHER